MVLSQEASELEAARVDIHLREPGNEVDVLVAQGKAYFKGSAREAEGEIIEYRSADQVVQVTAGRRPARARDSDGNFIRGDVLEMTVGTNGLRVLATNTGRTRGSSPITPGTTTDE